MEERLSVRAQPTSLVLLALFEWEVRSPCRIKPAEAEISPTSLE